MSAIIISWSSTPKATFFRLTLCKNSLTMSYGEFIPCHIGGKFMAVFVGVSVATTIWINVILSNVSSYQLYLLSERQTDFYRGRKGEMRMSPKRLCGGLCVHIELLGQAPLLRVLTILVADLSNYLLVKAIQKLTLLWTANVENINFQCRIWKVAKSNALYGVDGLMRLRCVWQKGV